ncbi:hypothetical protein MRB53_034884 [Persea americana]|uniref:Uncharacterized protein n=1 Tax=Persea americana TaxID=3435 RepID=A0ACC2K3L0_PERAE|nr:hypothetical protein MRB53_034884 [Persea americana]
MGRGNEGVVRRCRWGVCRGGEAAERWRGRDERGRERVVRSGGEQSWRGEMGREREGSRERGTVRSGCVWGVQAEKEKDGEEGKKRMKRGGVVVMQVQQRGEKKKGKRGREGKKEMREREGCRWVWWCCRGVEEEEGEGERRTGKGREEKHGEREREEGERGAEDQRGRENGKRETERWGKGRTGRVEEGGAQWGRGEKKERERGEAERVSERLGERERDGVQWVQEEGFCTGGKTGEVGGDEEIGWVEMDRSKADKVREMEDDGW